MIDWLLSLLIPQYLWPIGLGLAAGFLIWLVKAIENRGREKERLKNMEAALKERAANDEKIRKAKRARHSVDHSDDKLRNDPNNRNRRG